LKGISNKLKNKEHTAAAAAKEKQEKNPKTFIKLEDILLKFIHICFLLRTLFSPPPHFPPLFSLELTFVSCMVFFFVIFFYFDAFSICFLFVFAPFFCLAWQLKNYKQMVRHKIRHSFCLYFFVFRVLGYFLPGTSSRSTASSASTACIPLHGDLYFLMES